MPWNNQNGGGPWEPDDGASPWGRGGAGGPPRGPAPGDALEDLLRKGQARLRQILPGGGRGFLLVALAVLGIWLASGFYTVGPQEQGVVLRFGKYVTTTQPGLNYVLPAPIEEVVVVPVTRTRNVEIGFRSSTAATRNLDDESLMLTGDENIIDINFVVQWYVSNAADFVFNIRNPDQNVKDGAESVMREIIGRTDIEFALAEGREQVRQEAQALLQDLLDRYDSGIAVSALLLQRADPPPPVIDDYRDVQRARADEERLINEAQAYANRIVPEARGEAEQVLQGAEAYRQRVTAEAEGSAQRFLAVYDEYRQAEDVTRRRIYLETMEELMSNMNKVIVDDSGSGVVPYLPLPELRRRAEGARARPAAAGGSQ